MHRYIILKDDRTTENGIVLEGDESCTNHGRALAFEGALIDCPACKSEGRIVNVPPYRPFTLMNGRQNDKTGNAENDYLRYFELYRWNFLEFNK